MEAIFEKWRPQRDLVVPVYMQIESWIEGLIFDQVIPPHTPLPAVADLTGRFQVSAMTVQKAYRRLKERGLIYAISGTGTFVAPAERNRFVGLLIHREVLAAAISSPTILLHLDSLHKELAAHGYVDRVIVDNNPRHYGRRVPISADAMRVLEDQSLQAVIAVTHDGSDELFDLLKRRRLPSVGFNVHYQDYACTIELRQDDYVVSALRYLHEQGAREVGLMYHDAPERLDGHRVSYLQQLSGLFAAASIPMRPDWVVGVSDIRNAGGYQAFEHLWSGAQRPGALIIVDDVVARSALTAMTVRNVRVPQDLRVCVLTNTGSPLVFPPAWTRWEFDTADVCHQIVSAIQKLEKGEPAAKIIPAVPRPALDGAADRFPGERRSRVSFRTAGQILSLTNAG